MRAVQLRFEFDPQSIGNSVNEREVGRHLANVKNRGVGKAGRAQPLNVRTRHLRRRLRQLRRVSEHRPFCVVNPRRVKVRRNRVGDCLILR